MTVADFIHSWVEDSHNGENPGDQPESLLYLKDWHFVKVRFAYGALLYVIAKFY
jgi:hypothetical protein